MSEPRAGAQARLSGAHARLAGAWRMLSAERRLAAGAALALFATMLLPWYQQNAVLQGERGGELASRNLSAFAVFSFIEAAVLLVAVAVLVLLFARAEGRTFHLPGGDGTVVLGAGLWVVLLLVWRLFDKPGVEQNGVAANVGVQWGIFFALGAAGLLAYAGSRMRRAEQPEPPAERRSRRPRPPAPGGQPPPAPPAPGTAVTRVLPPERPPERSPRPRERSPRPPEPHDQLTIPLPPADESR